MSERYISLSQAVTLCPNTPTTACLWRWCRKGIKTHNGSRAYLQHHRIGALLYTTEQWLGDFFEAIAQADRQHFNNPIGKSTSKMKGI